MLKMPDGKEHEITLLPQIFCSNGECYKSKYYHSHMRHNVHCG
jgi:hypothetical protein